LPCGSRLERLPLAPSGLPKAFRELPLRRMQLHFPLRLRLQLAIQFPRLPIRPTLHRHAIDENTGPRLLALSPVG
jgi:hypothetical protein